MDRGRPAMLHVCLVLWAALVLAQARDYTSRLSDYREDEEQAPPKNDWRSKANRIQEMIAKMRAERRMRQEQLDASMGLDIAPVVIPPPRHRPHKTSSSQSYESYQSYSRPFYKEQEFSYKPPVGQPKSDFAYPPTDPRFFDQQRIETAESGVVVAGEAAVGKGQVDGQDSSGQAGHTSTTTTQETDDTVHKSPLPDDNQYMVFVAAVAGSSLFVVLALGFLGFIVYRFQRNVKAAANVDYPAYGVTGPNRDREGTPTGDRKLAQSAQMYHYQITKQQILCMENNQGGAESEADSEEENEEDYTVYECPGLAPTGEMEVKNPLFVEDPTPALADQPRQEMPRTDPPTK